MYCASAIDFSSLLQITATFALSSLIGLLVNKLIFGLEKVFIKTLNKVSDEYVKIFCCKAVGLLNVSL